MAVINGVDMESIAVITITNLTNGTTYSGICPSHNCIMNGVSITNGREINKIGKNAILELLNINLNISSLLP